MTGKRVLILLAAFSLAGSPCLRRLEAQQRRNIDWLRLVDHEASRPNYLAGLEPALPEAIALPPPPLGEPPAIVRALYGNAWIFGSSRFYDLVRLADTTEINALVLDVKDDTGYLTYRSSVPTAIAIGANTRLRSNDVRERLALLNQKGIHAIARIVVAKDPLLARMKPEWAIHDTRGGLWRDRQGNTWVDTYQDSVWTYAADLAAEAVLMGFGEVQFDYVRFPDEPQSLLSRAIYPAKPAGESQRQAVRRHLGLLRDRIKALGVPFTIDVFGLTTSATTDMGIGQMWEDLVREADVVLPMIYPSHYQRGAYGFARPNFEPYAVVKRALEYGIRRSASVSGAAKIRPFLQSFTLGRPRYTADEVRAQIRA
ncbi:MAG: hypothetical protein HY700_00115, partial [Gemmatimonadetes bacterium]|nr:hypothetical protein [Gemmatimonadota bacterium]